MAKKTEKKQVGLTPSDLAEYRELLLEQRAKIAQRVRRSSGTLHSSRQAGEESADVGGDDFIRETGLALISDDVNKLAQIEQALKDLDKGSYGICQDCHRPIGVARLRAKPYAKYCIDCKSLREKNGDRGPDEL